MIGNSEKKPVTLYLSLEDLLGVSVEEALGAELASFVGFECWYFYFSLRLQPERSKTNRRCSVLWCNTVDGQNPALPIIRNIP